MNRSAIEHLVGALINAVLFIVVVVIIVFAVDKNHPTPSPVEECKIDSATIANKKLILEVNDLDSIKNVETIEVKSLDNDSTLKLFYQLIRE